MGVDLGKLCYEQTISTWVVKSDLLIGVKLKHMLTMGDKSPGIITPLYKETNIVPNDMLQDLQNLCKNKWPI